MSPRFLVYPLLFIVLLQLGPMLRRDARWYAMQIAQLAIILLALGTALVCANGLVWTAVAWALFGLFVALPRLLLAAADRHQQRGRWRRAALAQQLAGGLIRGRQGRLHQQYAAILRRRGAGQSAAADQLLADLAASSLPPPVRGMVLVWQLGLLTQQRAWDRAVAVFDNTANWGTLWVVTQARLLVANAYSETGEFAAALRCLQFATLSPLALRLFTPLSMARVRLAALAGDAPELERLLANAALPHRGLARFAAYWRGRCALARSAPAAAIKELTRAYALTPPRDALWREAITGHLRRAEAAAAATTTETTKDTKYTKEAEPSAARPGPATTDATCPVQIESDQPDSSFIPSTDSGQALHSSSFICPAQTESYQRGVAALRQAEEQAAPWQALIQVGRPGAATLLLLAALTAVFVVELFLPQIRDQRLVWWAANSPAVLTRGEWWRPITALFLHANLLHLAMNGIGIWIFGAALENAIGRWRMLVLFFVGGALGNLASAVIERHELSIGASGGVFALVAGFVVAAYGINTPLYASLRRRLLGFLALMIAADLTIGWLEPQIDNFAHLGGLVAGLILSVLLTRRTAGPRASAQQGTTPK